MVCKESGFTLLEILLVIIIMAVSAMMIAPAYFSASSSTLDTETKRMAQLLRLMHEEAELSSRSIRVLLYKRSYRFESMDERGEWQQWEKPPFQARELAEGLVMVEVRPPQSLPEDLLNALGQKELPVTVLEMKADGWMPVVDLLMASKDSQQQTQIQIRPGPAGIAMQVE